MKTGVELNTDLGDALRGGEAPADWLDERLLACVTAVNLVCGEHAGTPEQLRAGAIAARDAGLRLGAHPSLPRELSEDGRMHATAGPDEVEASVYEQVSRLAEIAESVGGRVHHVKPHGALYHEMARSRAVAEGVWRAVLRIDPATELVGPAGREVLDWWREDGATVQAEAFADRRYNADHSLMARSKPGAVIADSVAASAQAVALALGEGVAAADGAVIHLSCETICIHGDTPGAASIARAVYDALDGRGLLRRG